MRIERKELVKFTVIILIFNMSLVFLTVLFLKRMDSNIALTTPAYGVNFSYEIIKHNLFHLIMTLLTFPISAVTISINWLLISFSIGLSIHLTGLNMTLYYLFPHGLIEMPTVIFYQFLAWKMMIQFWQKQQLAPIICFLKDNRYYLILTILATILSGRIEGSGWKLFM